MLLTRSFIKDVSVLTFGTIHSAAEDAKTYSITWLMWSTTRSIGGVVGSIVGSNGFITVNAAHICIIIVRYRRLMDQSATGYELDFGMNDQEFPIHQCRQVLQANAVKSMKSSSSGTVTDMTDIGLRTYSYGKGMTEERSYESHEWAMDSRSDIAPLLARSCTCEVWHTSTITITLEGYLWTTGAHIRPNAAHFGKERPPPEPPPVVLPPPEPPPQENWTGFGTIGFGAHSHGVCCT